jgi:trimethylamine--corrinoid protein Co-methyltransferase
MPEMIDKISFEQWHLDVSKDANTSGLEAARRLLDSYQAPPIDPAVDEALLAFIREREAVLPDSLD